MTVFDSPQFKLLPDPLGARKYANVSNLMEVSLEDGSLYHCPTAVPTGLFTLMKDVFKVPPEEQVNLSIDQSGARFVFSMMVEERTLYDLWTYTMTTIPKWILDDAFAVDVSG